MSIHRVGAATAIATAFACGGTAPPLSTSAVPLPAPPDAPAPAASASTSPAPHVEVLAPVSAVCEAETRSIYGPTEWIRLCDDALERCFLSFDGVQGRNMLVQVKPGNVPTALVTLKYQGFVFRGFIDLRPVFLYPKRDLILGDVFQADYVSLHAASDSALTVEATAGSGVFVDKPLRADVACDDMSWAGDWEPPEDQDKRLGAEGQRQLSRLTVDAPLFESLPAKKPIAELRTGGDEAFVNAYQRRGRYRFVTVWTESGTAFGWIASSAISRYNPMPGYFGHGASGGGKGFVSMSERPTGFRCRHDVPILARVGDALLEVGHVPADTSFALGRELSGGLRELRLTHPRYTDMGDPPEIRTVKDVTPTDEATLVVQRSSLEQCDPKARGQVDPARE